MPYILIAVLLSGFGGGYYFRNLQSVAEEAASLKAYNALQAKYRVYGEKLTSELEAEKANIKVQTETVVRKIYVKKNAKCNIPADTVKLLNNYILSEATSKTISRASPAKANTNAR